LSTTQQYCPYFEETKFEVQFQWHPLIQIDFYFLFFLPQRERNGRFKLVTGVFPIRLSNPLGHPNRIFLINKITNQTENPTSVHLKWRPMCTRHGSLLTTKWFQATIHASVCNVTILYDSFKILISSHIRHYQMGAS
jgi:hypothetical protein